MLGGVCFNVGCILLKVLLYVVVVIDEVWQGKEFGVSFGVLQIDLDMLWVYKNVVVGKFIQGLSGMVKVCKVSVIQGIGCFVDVYYLVVVMVDGE